MRLGQQQVIAPQLQQAIRMLQLSARELRQEMQEALESNPLLEFDEAEQQPDAPPVEEPGDAAEPPDLQLDELQVIPEDLPIDSRWDDLYQGVAPPRARAADEGEPLEAAAAVESLQDHLRWQLNLSALPERERLIAAVIIDAIDGDGMLAMGVADLADSFPAALGVDEAAVAGVLDWVQQLDPPGVGARCLEECLRLQLARLPAAVPWRREAMHLVSHHLHLLAAKDFKTLQRKTKCGEAQIGEIAALIGQLNPRPGAAYSTEPIEYVVPDVLVRKRGGRWTVELNPDSLPRLRINQQYAALAKGANSSRDQAFLRDNLNEANWFLKCLQSRHDTLLKVATEIVAVQRGFLEHGEAEMKPLVLRDIAEAVDMHDSTISRATSRKYMHTPRGVFELKYFFSSHVTNADGEEVSSTAIRALIRSLTAEENPKKPLSDSKIAAILATHNINVARRTVAKYRESMAIPPSSKRKRLV